MLDDDEKGMIAERLTPPKKEQKARIGDDKNSCSCEKISVLLANYELIEKLISLD